MKLIVNVKTEESKTGNMYDFLELTCICESDPEQNFTQRVFMKDQSQIQVIKQVEYIDNLVKKLKK